MFTKLLAVKEIQLENGDFSILGRRMAILPVEMLLKFHELIARRLGKEEADRLMFEAGEFQTLTGSIRFMARKNELRTMFKQLSTGDPGVEMGREVLRLMGLGDIRVKEITKDMGKVVLGTKNSPEAIEHVKTRGKSSGPVCHYERGVLAGVLGAVYGKSYSAEETACVATGLCDECLFELRRK